MSAGTPATTPRDTIEGMKPVLVLLAAAAIMPNLSQLQEMNARFAPVKPKYDESSLSAGDRKALPKLLDAARVLNYLYMDQLWSGTRALYAKLQEDKTPLGQARACRSTVGPCTGS